MKRLLLIILFLSFSQTINAAPWLIENEGSKVSFVSIKKGNIAEVNHFKTISGLIEEDGRFNVTISLASVATNIDIRDERMKTFLFEVDQFPNAVLTAKLDSKQLNAIEVGAVTEMQVQGTLSLHGQKQNMDFNVSVAKLSASELRVASITPVIINAADFKLLNGIAKLRELAGLSTISPAVPVFFLLQLNR